jgi:hypothetical protein
MTALAPVTPIPGERRAIDCWMGCGRSRDIVFPPYGGSYLSIYCEECNRAKVIFDRVYREVPCQTP